MRTSQIFSFNIFSSQADLYPCNAVPAHQSIHIGLFNGGTGQKDKFRFRSNYLTETGSVFSFCTLKIFYMKRGVLLVLSQLGF